MAWDRTRPVPWARLVRDWVLYVGIMCVVLLVVTSDDLRVAPFAGLLVSGPIFVAIGAVLAKFGYQRKTFRDLRAESAARARARAEPVSSAPVRQRPAPTRRTSGGSSPAARKRRR